MSIHIAATPGEIAPSVLMPGDPYRARFIAEKFLTSVECYNEVRGMLGYTGFYEGKRVSVQGSGMGIPSIGIYVHELFSSYGVEQIIRVGSCGGIQPNVKLRNVVAAMGACTDSSMNRQTFGGRDFAPIASFDLLEKSQLIAKQEQIKLLIGNILSTDRFYQESIESYEVWAKHGVLACEMESSALYTLAARFGKKALSLLTVSDNILTGEQLDSREREQSFEDMLQIALKLA